MELHMVALQAASISWGLCVALKDVENILEWLSRLSQSRPCSQIDSDKKIYICEDQILLDGIGLNGDFENPIASWVKHIKIGCDCQGSLEREYLTSFDGNVRSSIIFMIEP